MKTLKTILLITLLSLLTTSCTDLTEDLVPEKNKIENTQLGITGNAGYDTGGDNDNGDNETEKD